MKNPKHLIILATIAVIFIIATLFSKPTNIHIEGAGENVFPDLLSRANDVTYIKIQTHDNTLTLTKDQGIWRVKENDGYPADINKVRELVLGMGNLKRVEPKTSKAENYSRIGLQDVAQQGAKSTQITLTAGQDKTLADVIIGNNKASKAEPSQKSYYIRTPKDPQTWLADGMLPDGWQPKNWLDINIFEVKRDRIQQVKATHEDGEVVYIHRDSPDIRDFTLDSLKPGEQVTAPFEVNNIATTFTKMTFDDVVGETNAGIGDKPAYTAVLTTFDGLEITFQPYKKDGKHLAKYTASYNEAAATAYREKLAQEKESSPAVESAEEKDKPHGDAKKPKVELNTPEQVKQEAENYNKRWKNWLYQLPEFRIKNIGKKKADLLKKNDKPVH